MDLKNRNLRILNFTSYSLNGAISAIILKHYYPRCDTFFASYKKQDELLRRFIEAKKSYDCVVFTNFAPTQSREAFLNAGVPFVIFDHHENANWWKSTNNRDFHVNQDYSGAMMVYMYYVRMMADLDCFKDLAIIADDFELWKLKDFRSFHFNTLFWKAPSMTAFMTRWKNGGPFALTEDEKTCLKNHVQNWKKFYEELPQYPLEFNGRFITTNEYFAEISKQMDLEGVNYFIIYNPKSNYITIRSCNALINCAEVLGDLQVFSASSNVGVIPCSDIETAKKILVQVENAVNAHLPKEDK